MSIQNLSKLVLLTTTLLTISSSTSSAETYFKEVYYYYENQQGTLKFSDEPPHQVTTFQIQAVPTKERAIVRHAVDSKQNMSKTTPSTSTVTKVRELIAQYAKQFHVDPALVEAIVKTESEYDSMAISRKGARGLMQLMPTTAQFLGVSNLHCPKENLRGGIQYLQTLLNKYNGNIDLTLAAYNAGEDAVRKHNGIPPFQETIDYVAKVRKYYNYFVEPTTYYKFADIKTSGTFAP